MVPSECRCAATRSPGRCRNCSQVECQTASEAVGSVAHFRRNLHPGCTRRIGARFALVHRTARIAAVTANTRPHSRGAMRPRFCVTFGPLREEGAGKAGCALHPRSRVQSAQRKRTRAYRFSGGNPAFPAQWFYGLLRALPGDRLLATVIRRSLLPRNLAPAPGRQDHTTSPSAISRARQSHHCVHRIPPRVRDDREPPPCRVRREE